MNFQKRYKNIFVHILTESLKTKQIVSLAIAVSTCNFSDKRKCIERIFAYLWNYFEVLNYYFNYKMRTSRLNEQ